MISVLLHLAFFAGIGASLFAMLGFAHRMTLTNGRAYAWSCVGLCGSIVVLAAFTLATRIV